MVKVLRWGYRVPFVLEPLLSAVLVLLLSYSPSSVKGNAFLGELVALFAK